MRGKIFQSAFFSSLLVLLLSFLMVFSVLFHYFEEQMFSELQNETTYIAYGLEEGGENYLKHFQNPEKRVTLIAPNGTVLTDTSADAADLENHADRAEIREAKKNGSGRSSRYSDTLTEKTLYYAELLEDGRILRVSTTQTSVLVLLMGLLQPLFVIIAISLGVSFVLSRRAAKLLLRPIDAIDPENPERAEVYEELRPLLNKLTAQKKTIRHQIREAEKNREEFRQICENMNEGFLVLDKDGKVLSHNHAALRLLEVETVQNRHFSALNPSKGFRIVSEKALGGERAESTVGIGKNSYNFIANPVFYAGQQIGAVVVMIDVTENVRREQLRSEFTSNVSHELKTPLTSISGFAEMLKLGDMPEETVVDFAGSIYDEAQRLILLVSDIMKISELDEGAVYQKREQVDLHALSEEVIKRLEPMAKNRRVELRLLGDTAFVYGSKKILEEMIYNLCDNAIRYNHEGGSADISLTSNRDAVKLTVRDTGIGISQDEQSRVFERFYRVDPSRSGTSGGTGLGLAIVKHGALYHHAHVDLESAENQGTAVTLTFSRNA